VLLLELIVERGRERRETAEESGEGASEAEGLVGGGEKVTWMPCVPMVQSRYDVASSKSVRSDILSSHKARYNQSQNQKTHAHAHPPRKVRKEKKKVNGS
jgi:hypothetical protein